MPFCKLARKAHFQVRRCDVEDAGGLWDEASLTPSTAASGFRFTGVVDHRRQHAY